MGGGGESGGGAGGGGMGGAGEGEVEVERRPKSVSRTPGSESSDRRTAATTVAMDDGRATSLDGYRSAEVAEATFRSVCALFQAVWMDVFVRLPVISLVDVSGVTVDC